MFIFEPKHIIGNIITIVFTLFLRWNDILKVQSQKAQKSDRIEIKRRKEKGNEVQQRIQDRSLKAIR